MGMGAANIGDPQSFNTFAYTANDPVSLIDPSGLAPDFPEAYWGFDHFASGFWGWGYLGGNGWGSDPHPGLRVIQEAERAWDITLRRYHNRGGREGHLRGWNSDFDPEPCDLVTPTFDEAKSNPAASDLLNKRFGADAATRYGNLSTYFQAVLLNTIAAVAQAGVKLDAARFEGFYFGNNPTNPPFGIELSGISKSGLGKLESTPFGYRSPSSVKVGSVEATFEPGGTIAFDVDLFNPNGNLGRHGGEVIGNKLGQQTTDPRDVLKALNSRGVQTGVTCQ